MAQTSDGSAEKTFGMIRGSALVGRTMPTKVQASLNEVLGVAVRPIWVLLCVQSCYLGLPARYLRDKPCRYTCLGSIRTSRPRSQQQHQSTNTCTTLTDLDLLDVAEVDQAEGKVTLVKREAVGVGLSRVAGAGPGGAEIPILGGQKTKKNTTKVSLHIRG